MNLENINNKQKEDLWLVQLKKKPIFIYIRFTIFVHGNDRVDKLTGIPRHDLLAALIRENFAWTGFEIEKPTPIGNKESTTDNNYLVRTLQYQCVLPNDLVISSNGTTSYKNKRW